MIEPTTDFDRAAYFDALLRDRGEDSNELVQVARMHRAQAELLEMVNADEPLPELLCAVVSKVEHLIARTTAAISLISEGVHPETTVGPRLPEDLRHAIHEQMVAGRNPQGERPFLRHAVWTTDIQSDERWKPWAALAESHGLRACWTIPAVDPMNGQALAVLSVYSSERRSPTALQIHVLEDMARILRIAILTHRAEQQWLVLTEENQRNLIRLTRLLEATTEGIYGVDAEGRCTFMNPAAVRMLGVESADDAIGMDMHELIHHSRPDGSEYPRGDCPILRTLQTGEALAVHDELIARSDGQALPVTLSASPKIEPRTGEVVGAVVVFNDRSERWEYEQQLEQALKSKDEFIASIAHELRTPLTAVVGFSDLLGDGWQQMDVEEVSDLIGHITREASEVAYLVEDLLVAARADMGRVALRPELVDLADEVRPVLSGWRQGALRHVVVAESGDGLVNADPARVRQIVRNLLTNALKYGGKTIDITVGQVGKYRYVDVIDDGPGIPPDEVESVFEPYARAHDVPGLTASLGLGLSISRRLAQAMGGHLTYLRHDGRTHFRLTLPVYQPTVEIN